MFPNYSNSFSTKRPRFVPTFGRLASLSLLCSALSLPLSGLADGTNGFSKAELTTAVADGVWEALTSAPLNLSGSQINAVSWLYPSLQTMTTGEYLMYAFGYEPTSVRITDSFRDRLREIVDASGVITGRVDTLVNHAQHIDGRVDTLVGLSTDSLDLQHNIFDSFESLFSSGYGEYYVNVDGDGALRVSDPLVLDLLDGLLAASTNVEYYLDEMLGNDNADRDEGTSQASQQAVAAQNMVDSEVLDRESELHEVMDEEETTSSYLHGLIEDFVLPVQEVAESAYPGDENSAPGLEFTDFRSQGLGIKLWNDLRYPNGDVWIGEQYWSPSSWGSPNNPDAPNAMLRNFGTMMSYVYGVGFGLWVFCVVRHEWRYYMLGGGSDAHIQAEQMAANDLAMLTGEPWLME